MSSDFLPNSSSSLNLEFGEASFTKFFEGENVRMHLQQSIHTFGNKIEHGEETCLTNCVEYKPGSDSRRGGHSGFENDIKDLKLYEFDSITKDGFELLLAQSEVRKYLRKTKHEIPKLAEFAEAFKPPTSKEILCFTRQYYIGEDNHLQNKAVMTVDVDKLELSSAEKHKFLLICGPRYDGENTIKFSYDKFPNYAQNKNYLGDLLNKILEEVKNPDTDKFEDIPLDLRHIKKKKKSFKFPIEWVKKTDPS